MKHRPTVAEINLNALRHNFYKVKELSGTGCKLLAIVKANAYGHGAVAVSQELESCGVDYLGVAMCEEAAELRHAGIKIPIMLMGGIYNDQANEVLKYDLVPVIFNSESALYLNAVAAQHRANIKVHVKLDTGMGRIGVMPDDFEAFFQTMKTCKNLALEGLLTHLAVADACDESLDHFSREQISTFLHLIDKVREMGFAPSWFHLANSAAIIRNFHPPFNMMRPGLMLYGINPCPQIPLDLKPVMSLKTRIIALKKVPKGYSISYRRTFVSDRERIIATLPIGYADGYSRQWSNKAKVIIHGHMAPVVGIVCMDMVMVDVTDVPDVRLYDDVVLIGSQGEETITARDLAQLSETIPYEVLCSITNRVHRSYIYS